MTEQAERLTKLKLRLGEEQFELVALNASEGLSQPFLVVIDVISKLGTFDLLPHLGKPAIVESLADGAHMRWFHGIITDGQLVGEALTAVGREAKGEYLYRLTLQPKAHFHGFGRDNRIFQDKSVRDIVKDVLGRCRIDFDERLQGPGADHVLKYCVQFGESDMAFASRLMEEHGIYYFYRHEEAKHVMVLCDNPGAHTAIDCGELPYNPLTGGIGNSVSEARGAGSQRVTDWQEFLRTGGEAKATFRDYDFTRPGSKAEGVATGRSQHADDAIEVYDWPGRFYVDAQGKDLAEMLLESRRAQRASYQGNTSCTEVRPGYTFKLTRHPNSRFDAEYLIIGVHTTLAAEHYGAGGAGSAMTEVGFTAIPAATRFRAPQITPRPLARGPETAVVVGPQGEEIYVDKYGRIKVQFHWDRLGQNDDKSSCWIRVSQTGGLGNIIIPRIGHEVLVDFINGDPDRPIVVGRVFNASYMPVYPLPDNKTRAVWRSKTYKRTESNTPGDAKSFEGEKPAANEIRFEDKTDDEEFYIHAEKNMNTVVRYCDTLKVGKDQTIEIGKDQKLTVYQNRTKEVQQNETTTVFQNRTEEVRQNEKITIQMNRTEEVTGDEKVTIHGNRDGQIDGNDTRKITGNLKIDVDGSIQMTANQKIVLQCGASKIEISPSSIEISSVKLSAEGQATASISGGAKLDLSGGGMATLSGALVKIN